jgi:hypothetical protein
MTPKLGSTGSRQSNTPSLRGQPGAEHFLCGALYTVFVWFSTLLGFLARLVKHLEQDAFWKDPLRYLCAVQSARQSMEFHLIQMSKLSIEQGNSLR